MVTMTIRTEFGFPTASVRVYDPRDMERLLLPPFFERLQAKDIYPQLRDWNRMFYHEYGRWLVKEVPPIDDDIWDDIPILNLPHRPPLYKVSESLDYPFMLLGDPVNVVAPAPYVRACSDVYGVQQMVLRMSKGERVPKDYADAVKERELKAAVYPDPFMPKGIEFSNNMLELRTLVDMQLPRDVYYWIRQVTLEAAPPLRHHVTALFFAPPPLTQSADGSHYRIHTACIELSPGLYPNPTIAFHGAFAHAGIDLKGLPLIRHATPVALLTWGEHFGILFTPDADPQLVFIPVPLSEWIEKYMKPDDCFTTFYYREYYDINLWHTSGRNVRVDVARLPCFDESPSSDGFSLIHKSAALSLIPLTNLHRSWSDNITTVKNIASFFVFHIRGHIVVLTYDELLKAQDGELSKVTAVNPYLALRQYLELVTRFELGEVDEYGEEFAEWVYAHRERIKEYLHKVEKTGIIAERAPVRLWLRATPGALVVPFEHSIHSSFLTLPLSLIAPNPEEGKQYKEAVGHNIIYFDEDKLSEEPNFVNQHIGDVVPVGYGGESFSSELIHGFHPGDIRAIPLSDPKQPNAVMYGFRWHVRVTPEACASRRLARSRPQDAFLLGRNELPSLPYLIAGDLRVFGLCKGFHRQSARFIDLAALGIVTLVNVSLSPRIGESTAEIEMVVTREMGRYLLEERDDLSPDAPQPVLLAPGRYVEIDLGYVVEMNGQLQHIQYPAFAGFIDTVSAEADVRRDILMTRYNIKVALRDIGWRLRIASIDSSPIFDGLTSSTAIRFAVLTAGLDAESRLCYRPGVTLGRLIAMLYGQYKPKEEPPYVHGFPFTNVLPEEPQAIVDAGETMQRVVEEFGAAEGSEMVYLPLRMAVSEPGYVNSKSPMHVLQMLPTGYYQPVPVWSFAIPPTVEEAVSGPRPAMSFTSIGIDLPTIVPYMPYCRGVFSVSAQAQPWEAPTFVKVIGADLFKMRVGSFLADLYRELRGVKSPYFVGTRMTKVVSDDKIFNRDIAVLSAWREFLKAAYNMPFQAQLKVFGLPFLYPLYTVRLNFAPFGQTLWVITRCTHKWEAMRLPETTLTLTFPHPFPVGIPTVARGR